MTTLSKQLFIGLKISLFMLLVILFPVFFTKIKFNFKIDLIIPIFIIALFEELLFRVYFKKGLRFFINKVLNLFNHLTTNNQMGVINTITKQKEFYINIIQALTFSLAHSWSFL